ncbi:hypothetical protein M413DRAFT_441916 [Hebeloma cylindrosporum]|uniref:E3 ubiquitin protein ligase n=1 Tax=Hebeloma cylindrosporum TaxID=76867 RepID=A0A0C2Y5X0_HEBCY|nr:hypothetical protein M413DRAFT_441916 [Hebeloma cylindrosporum h7]
MESRKRPLPDDDDSTIAKKRILTGANGSPQVNGALDHDHEAFGEKLETFRKEAIYRRMMHYSKEHERSRARIRELEQRKSTCEAGLAAMTACWAQLVDTIRLLVKPDDLPQVTIRSKEIFDLTAHVQKGPYPKFSAALEDTTNATKALVTKFVQVGDDHPSRVLQSESFPECQKAQNECAILRSELNILRAKLEDSESQKENYHNALLEAESRLERSKSATVREMEMRVPATSQEPQSVEKEEVQQKPSSPVPSPAPVLSPVQSNGFQNPSEVDFLRDQLQSRDSKIMELEKEAALLRDQKTMIELEHKAPSVEQICETPQYKMLLNHASHLEGLLSEKNEQITRLQEEICQLKALHTDWEESATNANNQTAREFKAMLSKRDDENVRLREQRDQLSAEILERKQKDFIKFSAAQEYKGLWESSTQRLSIMESELSRTKAQLAVQARSKVHLLFFLGGNTNELRLFEDIKEQKLQAENRIAALEQTFSIYQDDHPDIVQHMKAQADALEKLEEVKAELGRYERTYGPMSRNSPEVSELLEQLRLKEDELEKLRLSEIKRKQDEPSTFDEITKLSTLWETMGRQLKNQISELASMEDRVSKGAADKAKLENRYYAAIRDRDAIENERKNLARTVEKQGKAVDRLTDVEKHYKSQMSALEKENAAWKKCVDALKDKLYLLEKDNPELLARIEQDRRRFHELSLSMQEREHVLACKKQEVRVKEDEVIRIKKEMEKELALLKKKSDSTTRKLEPGNSEMQSLNKLVMCSTCRDTPRSTIITKCMHTFCKPCVDARLATRQRKCPYCNLAFGQSDVHTFFFQG